MHIICTRYAHTASAFLVFFGLQASKSGYFRPLGSYMPNKRDENKVNVNAWLNKEAKDALTLIAARSRRSRAQTIELLVMAEAHRLLEESGDLKANQELYSLIEKYIQEDHKSDDQ